MRFQSKDNEGLNEEDLKVLSHSELGKRILEDNKEIHSRLDLTEEGMKALYALLDRNSALAAA